MPPIQPESRIRNNLSPEEAARQEKIDNNRQRAAEIRRTLRSIVLLGYKKPRLFRAGEIGKSALAEYPVEGNPDHVVRAWVQGSPSGPRALLTQEHVRVDGQLYPVEEPPVYEAGINVYGQLSNWLGRGALDAPDQVALRLADIADTLELIRNGSTEQQPASSTPHTRSAIV
ncbi:MAG TPA: hypothetical protein VF401_01460 [Candidatus Saccharimonadales bacterium]